MEKRIRELDVLRVVAMLFVITYHFGALYGERGIVHFNFLCFTPNYDFGNIAVTIFFILSGGLLYKKYGVLSGESLKGFYLKRAKSIYPPFWILSLYIPFSLIRHWIADGNAFVHGHPAKLLLTLVGMDGYVQSFGYETYFFGGEWFVGAILISYLAYPMLARIYKVMPVVCLAMLLLGYGSQFFILKGNQLEWLNTMPVTFLLKFYLGFFLFDHMELFRKKGAALVGLFLLLPLTFVNIPGIMNVDCFGTIAALCWFVVLFYSAHGVLQFGALDRGVQKLAALSYCVFLVQHVVISWTQMGYVRVFDKMQWDFSSWNVLALLLVTFLLILAVARVLKFVSDKFVRRLPF